VTDDELLVPVRPGDELDWPALEAHLRLHLELPAGEMRVRQFSAGHANLTYLLEFGDRSLVFRRPPRGTLAPGAHDMAREHKVLSQLWRAYPRALRSDYYDYYYAMGDLVPGIAERARALIDGSRAGRPTS